jgi:nondiscriminating aspartyl-tRNA synthetase
MDISNLNETFIDKIISLRGRIQSVRDLKKIKFLILRDQEKTLQCVISKTLKNIPELKRESSIKVTGIYKSVNKPVTGCSIIDFEVEVESVEIINKSKDTGIQINDNYIYPNSETKYDQRYLDLRNTDNQIIFKIKSKICQYCQEYLYARNFTQIHTPKIISSASEGGSNVFELKYFDKKAYLAQSPQLFKQMIINAEFPKIFEIGPVFRAEKSNTNRHLTEFTGIDIEMRITVNYYEVVHVLWDMLAHVLTSLDKNEKEIIQKLNPDFNLRWPSEPLIISYKESIKLLHGKGYNVGDYDDFSPEHEKELASAVKEKYGSDLFVLDKFPKSLRPFYTHEDDENYSRSYDFILRGMEILSGAQRIDNPEDLRRRAKECNVDCEKMKHYLDSFDYGSYPHGGGGFGLERITINILGLDNIRKGCLFHRDPIRLEP